jgi:hypothetical protein
MDSSEMGRKRWEGTTAKQRQEYARKLSAIRLKKLSKEERSEIARAAVKARWEKWRAEHPEHGRKPKVVKPTAKVGTRAKQTNWKPTRAASD